MTVIAALAAMLLTSAFAPAEAATGTAITHCGQALAGDMYLATDLTCDVGFAVPLDGDEHPGGSASVDLKGHRISGSDGGTAFTVGGDDVLFGSLTVRNGRIDHWDRGFSAVMAGLTLSHVRLDHNDVGLYCGAGNCDIDHSVMSYNRAGNTANDAAIEFTKSYFAHNKTASQTAGPDLVGVTYNDNLFDRNDVGVAVAPSGQANLTHNVFVGNKTGIQGSELTNGGGWSATLKDNLFLKNGDGVYLPNAGTGDVETFLGQNVAVGNKGYGFYVPYATDLGGNKAARNGKPCVGVTCTKP